MWEFRGTKEEERNEEIGGNLFYRGKLQMKKILIRTSFGV